MVLALQISVSTGKSTASEQALTTKMLAAWGAMFRYRRSDEVWALGISYQNWKLLGVILYNKLLKMLWGNCVPQESLETSLEGIMWNGLNCISELWLGILITRLLLVEHLDVWDFSLSDARFVRTFLFCLHFERIKIFGVEITVRYSVWSWERWWRTEANACLYLLVIIRNTTNLSVIKQTSQRQNMYWNHGKTSFGSAL